MPVRASHTFAVSSLTVTIRVPSGLNAGLPPEPSRLCTSTPVRASHTFAVLFPAVTIREPSGLNDTLDNGATWPISSKDGEQHCRFELPRRSP